MSACELPSFIQTIAKKFYQAFCSAKWRLSKLVSSSKFAILNPGPIALLRLRSLSG